VCTLQELAEKEVDMFTTVFIGNSGTRIIGGRLVTPRGYAFEGGVQ
jgi:precorrin-3B C17-methyltransferase